jgi:hypothetical protein
VQARQHGEPWRERPPNCWLQLELIITRDDDDEEEGEGDE